MAQFAARVGRRWAAEVPAARPHWATREPRRRKDGRHRPGGFVHIGKAFFALDIDGTPQAFDFVQVAHFDGIQLSKLWFFNFPAGMTGSHVFTGHWYQACNNDSADCNGARRGTPVEVGTLTATVTFE